MSDESVVSVANPPARSWRDRLRAAWPGLLLAGVVATASLFISETRGGPTLLYALLIGMALNSVTAPSAKPGIDLAARTVLRFGVALLGARITYEQVSALGWQNGLLLLAGVGLTIGFGFVVSRALGLSRRLGVLTGGATAICGASAAIAIAAVLPRDEKSERELIFTVAGVTALSTLAMVLYPVLVKAFGLDDQQAGFFLGGTIHDVAQVVGAGYSIAPGVGDYAVITKLLRVAMLLPVVLAISFAVRHRLQAGQVPSGDPLIPPFLLAFVAFVVAGSFGLIPKAAGVMLGDVARGCLVVAISAVGLKTSLAEIRKVGMPAFVLLAAETVFLALFVLGTEALLRWWRPAAGLAGAGP